MTEKPLQQRKSFLAQFDFATMYAQNVDNLRLTSL